jgi:hypothetical protein
MKITFLLLFEILLIPFDVVGQNEPPIDSVINEIRKNEKFFYSGHITAMHIMEMPENFIIDPPEKRTITIEQKTLVNFSFEQNRYYCSFIDTVTYAYNLNGGIQRGQNILENFASFNGEIYKHIIYVHEPSKITQATGRISNRRTPILMNLLEYYLQLHGEYFGDILSNPRNRIIYKGEEKKNDVDCFLFEVDNIDYKEKQFLWFSLKYYHPIAIEITCPQRIAKISLKYDYTEKPPYFYKSTNVIYYERDKSNNKFVESKYFKTKIIGAVFNIPISRETFDIVFPSGLVVYDHRIGKKIIAE